MVGGCGGYALLGAREGGFGAFQVYLVCMFRGVGKDRYLVADDFHEASAYRHVRLFAVARYADFARAKGGEQRRVAGQDAKLARAARGDERADFLGVHHPLGGYDFESHVCHGFTLKSDWGRARSKSLFYSPTFYRR